MFNVIAISGPEAVGKSTAIQIIKDILTKLDYNVEVFVGLGSGVIGAEVRKQFLAQNLNHKEAALYKLTAITDALKLAQEFVAKDPLVNIALIDRDYYSHEAYDALYFNNYYSKELLKLLFPSNINNNHIVDLSIYLYSDPELCVKRITESREDSIKSFLDTKPLSDHILLKEYFDKVYTKNSYSRTIKIIKNNDSLKDLTMKLQQLFVKE